MTTLRIDRPYGQEYFIDMKVNLIRFDVEWPKYEAKHKYVYSLKYPFCHQKTELTFVKGSITFFFSNGDVRRITYSDRKALLEAIKQIEEATLSTKEVIFTHESNVSYSSSNPTY